VARAVWSGSIGRRLVNVPVKVCTAVWEHGALPPDKRSGSRMIRYEKIAEASGEPWF
jgi:non-homologous end joining protein Ku